MEKNTNKKKLVTGIALTEITKESYEQYKTLPLYDFPGFGKASVKSAFKSIVTKTNITELFRQRIKAIDENSLHLSMEEAEEHHILVLGNKKLGIRLYNETALLALSDYCRNPEEKRQFQIAVACIFHREELEAQFSGKKPEVELPKTPVIPAGAKSMPELAELIAQQNALIVNQNLILGDITKALALLTQFLVSKPEAVINQDKEPVPEMVIEPYLAAEPKISTPEETTFPEPKTAPEPFHTSLQLGCKNRKKDPFYRKREDVFHTYRENVLKNVPMEMRGNVLNRAYVRMRDDYDIPLETFRVAYFNDTGKTAKSPLEIAHWIEFYNLSTRGLMRSCVEAVLPECVDAGAKKVKR